MYIYIYIYIYIHNHTYFFLFQYLFIKLHDLDASPISNDSALSDAELQALRVLGATLL